MKREGRLSTLQARSRGPPMHRHDWRREPLSEMTVGRLMDLLKHEDPDAVVRIVDHEELGLDDVYGRWRPWEIDGGELNMPGPANPDDLVVFLVTDRRMSTRLVPGVGWVPYNEDEDGE